MDKTEDTDYTVNQAFCLTWRDDVSAISAATLGEICRAACKSSDSKQFDWRVRAPKENELLFEERDYI